MKRMLEIINLFVNKPKTGDGATVVQLEGTTELETPQGVRTVALRLAFPLDRGLPAAFDEMLKRSENGKVDITWFEDREELASRRGALRIHKGHLFEVELGSEARLDGVLRNRDNSPVTVDAGGRLRVPVMGVRGADGPALKFVSAGRRALTSLAKDEATIAVEFNDREAPKKAPASEKPKPEDLDALLNGGKEAAA